MYRTWPAEFITLNAACIDGIDIFDLDVDQFDGKTMVPGDELHPLPESYLEES